MVELNENHKKWLKPHLPDKYDLEAMWDSTLTYSENKQNILEQIGVGVAEESKKKAQQDFLEHYEKEVEDLFSHAKPRSGESEDLLKEITDYAPYTELITMSTLIAVNQKINVINMSRAGLGKTRSTADLMDVLNIPFVLVAGRITPKQFFRKLEMVAGGGYMIIDESATLLKDNTIKELLLSALWGGTVTWETEREELSVRFKGTIIFNTNSLSSDEFTRALKDRVIFNHLVLDREQIREKILSKKVYEYNGKIWAEIRNNCFNKTELSQEQENLIWDFLKILSVKSVRDEWRLRKIAKGLNNILGDLQFLKKYLKIDEVYEILMSDSKRSEKVSAISEVKKISIRQARNMVKKYEEEGEW